MDIIIVRKICIALKVSLLIYILLYFAQCIVFFVSIFTGSCITPELDVGYDTTLNATNETYNNSNVLEGTDLNVTTTQNAWINTSLTIPNSTSSNISAGEPKWPSTLCSFCSVICVIVNLHGVFVYALISFIIWSRMELYMITTPFRKNAMTNRVYWFQHRSIYNSIDRMITKAWKNDVRFPILDDKHKISLLRIYGIQNHTLWTNYSYHRNSASHQLPYSSVNETSPYIQQAFGESWDIIDLVDHHMDMSGILGIKEMFPLKSGEVYLFYATTIKNAISIIEHGFLIDGAGPMIHDRSIRLSESSKEAYSCFVDEHGEHVKYKINVMLLVRTTNEAEVRRITPTTHTIHNTDECYPSYVLVYNVIDTSDDD